MQTTDGDELLQLVREMRDDLKIVKGRQSELEVRLKYTEASLATIQDGDPERKQTIGAAARDVRPKEYKAAGEVEQTLITEGHSIDKNINIEAANTGRNVDRNIQRKSQFQESSFATEDVGEDEEPLKRKDFIGVTSYEIGDITEPGYSSQVLEAFSDARSFMRFLCKAIGVAF